MRGRSMTTILTRTPKAPLNIRRMSFGERLRVKQQRNAVRSSFLGAFGGQWEKSKIFKTQCLETKLIDFQEKVRNSYFFIQF